MAKFIIANRLSGTGERKAKRDSGDRVETMVAGFADIRHDNKPENTMARRIYRVECDHVELGKKLKDFPPDVLVEPEYPRFPALSYPGWVQKLISSQGVTPEETGIGEVFEVTLRGNGVPIVDAKGIFFLNNLRNPSVSTRIETTSDGDGKIQFMYDPALWFPSLLLIDPRSGYWSVYQPKPVNGMAMDLYELPKTGPIGWWHTLAGAFASDFNRGQGIKIGIVDTGVGPHPYLKKVKGVGSIIGGAMTMKPSAAKDAQEHGTHVSGIIAAHPVDGSGDYEGLAPGAETGMIRVFGETGGASQADITDAIDYFSENVQADLVNLSLGSPNPSPMEQDAVMAAAESGTLCLAAAGNSHGEPVMYPAAYPQTAAISAVGLLGTCPANSLAGNSIPSQRDRFANGGIFVADFCNVGWEMTCTAPGVGIISTVPARPEVPAPYAAMSGTSMASPLATAALASNLAQDQYYLGLPRGMDRITRASAVLASTLLPLGLSFYFTGGGMIQACAGKSTPSK